MGFGAILVGYHEGGDFVYAGKVGSGFDDDTVESLGERMSPLERSSHPSTRRASLPSGRIHWIEPEVVVVVEFTEWTQSGRLRHPRFVGIRRDKDPGDVVRERPS